MSNLDIENLTKEVQNVENKIHERKNQIDKRHDEAKAIKTAPSNFLHSVFEKLIPLAKLIADDGDVTNAEMASKEQNQALEALLKPVMASFKDSEKRYEDVESKFGTLLEQTQENEQGLGKLATDLNNYKVLVENKRVAEERSLADAVQKKDRYSTERESLKIRERELEARRLDNDGVVHPKREPGVMGWVKEIGWGLALNDRDADNPYQMNDAEMLLESCRQELIAVEALQKSNDRSLQEAENHVRSYQGRVASAQSTLKTIVTTSKKLEEALVDQRAVSNQIQQDVDYLLHQRTGLETMHQSMSDASAAGVAGLRIAYRKKFAVAIIKVLIATPMDEGISSQMDIILHILQTIPPNSQIYAEVLPTFKSVEDRIKAAKGVVV